MNHSRTGIALVMPLATTTPLYGELSSTRGERLVPRRVGGLDAIADQVTGGGPGIVAV